VLLGALLAALPLLPPAAAARWATLPRTGIAVATSRGVDLVDLAGHVRRSLAGYGFRLVGLERPGQVELRDRRGHGYELRGGELVRVRADTVTLGHGYALRLRRGWLLLRDGRTVERFAPGTHLEVDSSGTIVTAVGANSTPVARNLRTGARWQLASGCRVVARFREGRFEACGYPFGARASAIVRVDSRGRRRLAGPARPGGWWTGVTPSPDGTRLLAQWSGECESPTAYLVDARTGRLTLLGSPGGAAESVALGWHGARPVVQLPSTACGAAGRPGVYLFEGSAPARLVLPLPPGRPAGARLWH
jgi:hypothetical protein